MSYLVLPEIPAWFDLALCAQTDPEAFFPQPGNVDPELTRHALAVCGRCEVRETCLQYANEERIEHGIWGGETAHQRARRRKGRAARLPRQRTVCSKGHPLVEGNFRVRADGARMCLKCDARRARERRARLAAEEVSA